MIIGIPKETKLGECRVALVPEHIRLLTNAGHEVYVERDAGRRCKFSNRQYETAGAKIVDDVYGCEMIVRVKEPPQATIRQNQTIMGYLHIEKGQNMALLKKLLDLNATSIAFEEIRDVSCNRLVNLGVEAGIVGMYEGLRLHGKILEKHGKKNKYVNLKPIKSFFCVDNVYKALEEANLENSVNVFIFGKGRVSQGAQKILSYTKIKPSVLYRDGTRYANQFLPKADIIINAIDWYPSEPRIITKPMLKLMKPTSVIVDISCDENGAIESCIPTTWQKPAYVFDGITHYCVDNLPSAIPRDASVHLSSMIIEHVLAVAEGRFPNTGLMTRNGVFEYALKAGTMEKFQELCAEIPEFS